ncbi:alpha-glucuronidase [Paenibacillus qinlingensis]|uniref:Alpha-glucuronidase n=1 Tax=Paenibacillus qinlingensis TaxID=1837343 RepID=A0ABU1P2V4_9BACL|nr:alpha-glucuronidase [Paenibacillus qinlingensis]MDR6553904.1 alpha-glucuronidase [Paenibacillus qinlingensis]
MDHTQRKYSEYKAWLQPKSSLTPKALRIRADFDLDFIHQECRLGLNRLWGEIKESAAYTLQLKIDDGAHEAYSLTPLASGFEIAGGSKRGLLYGVYRFLNRLATGESIDQIHERSAPQVDYRIINHWDNMDGHIERGYAGQSFFFAHNQFDYDAERITDYARLMASIGINGICINNVNVNKVSAGLIAEPLLSDLADLAALFRPFGIRLMVSVHFDAPMIVGGLTTSDPLDAGVKEFWRAQSAVVYDKIPDFLGYVVKADSEFRGGPEAFGRTQADGANTIAAAVAPFGGLVFWRCFVYNCQQDWRDAQTDRPMAAYKHFQPLDGAFDQNVILQIKNGPVDFQTREPVSPLFSSLTNTHEAIEFQIAQEYTGQQIDLFSLAVQWEEILTTEVNKGKQLRGLFGHEITAVTAVTNTGNNMNWTGNTLAQCNLYAFGRIAWNPDLTAKELIREWIRITFETDEHGSQTIEAMLLQSRDIYENYTAPLGIGFMVNPSNHYGPNVDGYEFSHWGTYHRADFEAIGVDRTSKGTGFTTQYPESLQNMYDHIATCPEELLLFFHRVRYDYQMKDGRTLLQYIYDSHFEGAQQAEALLQSWETLENRVPQEAFYSVKERLKRQLRNAREWRDQVNTYFYRKSGIDDEKGRQIYR